MKALYGIMQGTRKESLVYYLGLEGITMVQRMSETELQISSIKNLDMVNIYHLFDDGKSLLGILAYYEGSKVINLCAADEGFPVLLDKIVEVYSREKQYGRIVLDYNTKQILDRSISLSTDNYGKMLSDFTETAKPIFLDKAFIHVLTIPLVKYVVEGIYGVNDMPVNWDIYNKSWYGHGILTASVNRKTVRFPYRITRQNDKLYRVIINGVLKQSNTLTIDIMHDMKGIGVSFYDGLYGYVGKLEVDIAEDVPTFMFSIDCAGKRVYYKEDSIAESDSEDAGDVTKLSFADTVFKEYRLPWGERIFVAVDNDRTQCVFAGSSVAETISYGICSVGLDDNKKTRIGLGLFSYMLFESASKKELHFLDMGYPQLALYKDNFAGKCYTLNKGVHHGN